MSGLKISGFRSTSSGWTLLWMCGFGNIGLEKSSVGSSSSKSTRLEKSGLKKSSLGSSGLGSTRLGMSHFRRNSLEKSSFRESSFEKSGWGEINSILHHDGCPWHYTGNFNVLPACFCLQFFIIVKI